MNYKENEYVEIDKDATLYDLMKNSWNGCQIDTLNFLRDYGGVDDTFRIKKVLCSGCVILDLDDEYLVNTNILKKVEIQPKEMTKEEIEKELGYKIKIIRGNKWPK